MQDQINVELPFAKITLYIDIFNLVERGDLRFKSFAELPQQILEMADAKTAKRVAVGVRIEFTQQENIVSYTATQLITEKINETAIAHGLTTTIKSPFNNGTDWYNCGASYEYTELTSGYDGSLGLHVVSSNGIDIRGTSKNIPPSLAVPLTPYNAAMVSPNAFGQAYAGQPAVFEGTYLFDGDEHKFVVSHRNYPLKNFMSNDDIVAGIYQEVYKAFPFVERYNLLANVHMD